MTIVFGRQRASMCSASCDKDRACAAALHGLDGSSPRLTVWTVRPTASQCCLKWSQYVDCTHAAWSSAAGLGRLLAVCGIGAIPFHSQLGLPPAERTCPYKKQPNRLHIAQRAPPSGKNQEGSCCDYASWSLCLTPVTLLRTKRRSEYAFRSSPSPE